MVSIKNQLIRAAAVGAVAAAAMAGVVAPASASAGMHVTAVTRVAVKGPNTNITGSPAKWMPTKLTGPPITGKCTAKNFTVSMTNKTKKTQSIQVNTGMGKMPFAKIPAGKAIAACGSGPKGAKATFSITGSKSLLTVTLS